MNKKLGLAVAGAILALSSTANAGITIPAGDWTIDIGGVVNAYYTSTKFSGDTGAGAAALGLGDGNGNSVNNITTGLLPNVLAISGKTRQNDLDIGFTIAINPGTSTRNAAIQGGGATNEGGQENRQAFLTIGDASWGSVKLGKDLGIYASDAILNDMTLLGVGAGAGSLAGNTTTLGRIGTGFMYADWKAQVAYTTPNWNGFQATVGVTQAWNALAGGGMGSSTSTDRGGNQPAYEAKASYSWAGDVAGKVWVSAISQKVRGLTNAAAGGVGLQTAAVADPNGAFGLINPIGNTITDGNERANAWDIGTSVNVAGFGLTGYYYTGDGIGQTMQFRDGFDRFGKRRQSDGYYVQATYSLPTATKIGVSFGESRLDGNSSDAYKDVTDQMWVVGAYHPLTKSVNLVAEYAQSERKVANHTLVDAKAEAKTVSLGAILFF
jgi:predicted porin